jgi:two-component sensor histidine kinase
VTDRTAAAERQELLMRELDHRAKNALAVVQAALRLTPKDDPSAYARAVEGRVAALARAHTLLARAQWTGADLRAMAEGELAPFLDTGASAPGAGPRAELDGPPLALKPGAAQALSMALHELATNATKHGALSASGGRVSLSWRVDRASGELRLRWVERGGPRVSAPPARRGFGSRVLDGTVRGQLGGAVSRAWEPAGLVCEVGVPLAQVAPSAA